MSKKETDTPTHSASKTVLYYYNYHIDCPLIFFCLKAAVNLFGDTTYRTEIKAFLSNYFSNHDLNFATFLVPYVDVFLNMQSTVGNEICYYFNSRSNKAPTQYIKLLENKKNWAAATLFLCQRFSQPATDWKLPGQTDSNAGKLLQNQIKNKRSKNEQ